MMHGAIRSDSAEFSQLGRMVIVLQSVVLELLKEQLGMPSDEPPIIRPDALLMHPGTAVSGVRELNQDDVDELVRTN
jgi:hypothetical protein